MKGTHTVEIRTYNRKGTKHLSTKRIWMRGGRVTVVENTIFPGGGRGQVETRQFAKSRA